MSKPWFTPSRPITVDGGLQARSRRGAIAQTWWSQRFIAVLETMGMGNRLQRGRAYARRGQVVSLSVEPGVVTASVQGSRARPYQVRITVIPFGKADWARAEKALAADAWLLAALLAGQMPAEIDEVFTDLGLPLFPTSAQDMSLDCSCPDWEVPCKHLAAVFYLLAESFDTDPFGVLAWRGRTRDDLLGHLRLVNTPDTAATPAPLPLTTFFELQGPLPTPSPPVTATDALLDQLPPVDVTARGQSLPDLLRPAYTTTRPAP